MSKNRIFKSILILMLVWSNASSQAIDYSVHANIIYHLTKYMEWPADKSENVFVIGVIGETSLVEELQTTTLNREVNNRRIVIRNFSCSQSTYSCQILFISEDESRCLKNIADITSESPVLIITEKEGLALKGSGINFMIDDGHLKMEINKSTIEEHNLKIASELLTLGIVVKNSQLTKK